MRMVCDGAADSIRRLYRGIFPADRRTAPQEWAPHPCALQVAGPTISSMPALRCARFRQKYAYPYIGVIWGLTDLEYGFAKRRQLSRRLRAADAGSRRRRDRRISCGYTCRACIRNPTQKGEENGRVIPISELVYRAIGTSNWSCGEVPPQSNIWSRDGL